MINKLKDIARTEDRKRLLSNFFSLSVLQIFSYILPLLTVPYLVRVPGVGTFGTAIANELSVNKNNNLILLSRNQEKVNELND